jgi:outer membrane lipoprotein SlyB
MSTQVRRLGTVTNTLSAYREVTVPSVTIVLGAAAVGAWVGFAIGGSHGAAAGALVGAFVGGFAVGYIKKLRVRLYPDGSVEVEIETHS